MASHDQEDGHLDATSGREVVYCHACTHEWHRDEHGLECPDCGSDITEIVEADNDPREVDDDSLNAPSSGLLGLRHYEDDSDPEEADIEEHLGPHGFVHRRSVRAGDGHDNHHEPGIAPVLNRFYEMLETFGQPRPMDSRETPTRNPGSTATPLPTVHRATFTTGPFGRGTASVTIYSGPVRHNMGHANNTGHAPADPFQSIFSDVLRDMGPPPVGHGNAGPTNPDDMGPQVQTFARSLHDILSLFSPANAMAGDAVYSQEALDRIITQLMEANPQSNAAPPASDQALRSLDRRPVDREMLKGETKTECTICIDELKIGDMAVFLPCKHWFHEDCVVLWLKEHNTCPICRTPIEKRNGPNDAGSTGQSDNASAPNASGLRSGPAPYNPSSVDYTANATNEGPRRFRTSFSGHFGGNYSSGAGRANEESTRTSEPTHPRAIPGRRSSQLNEAFRAVTTIQQERDRARGRGTPSQTIFDTSRLQRRTSLSPSSPRQGAMADYGSRMRQRSPSESSRRGQGDRVNGRSGGQGPISWLRDRFSSSGGSNQGSSRDDRRQ
ncbi:RING-type E3 ubiquitin transferase [Purpureocillium takamizusanense]|uniref:RING-type E3 ubiquitin transferase n=1 Tax=Purpureocillium takamizusanense TaxID=2060973 RepID=A0A9Q8VCV0_9HYPO|nr:RING-type E3 ubiquitin transferase [Purpureocillium takamizusanense]UNI22040.1 RING-type E3 ubiquitin transferase [Purpureocillium takamizusanense]